MKTKVQRQQVAIAQAIESRGVDGVHVTVIANDGTYLDGEVHNAEEEAIAVDAAIHAGAEKVIDGLHYPGVEETVGHLDERHRGTPSVTPQHQNADDPGLRILKAAHLDERIFSASSSSSPVQTGTPID
ncbi:MAG: hypothetical protein HY902_05725 [Deltaproteobacteria bacterium]|nr:hypothetical protein [Deltaproteobacteria bacterium]